MSAQGMIYNIQRMSVHDGPGIRSTVFFKGCPLRCAWCSNPESQDFSPQVLVFEDLCVGCGACEAACPHAAITNHGPRRHRDRALCRHCGVCAQRCPVQARAVSGREYTVEEVMHILHKDRAFYRNSGGGVTFGGGECTAQGDFLLALLHCCQRDGLHVCVDTCGHCAPELWEKLMPLTNLFLYDLKHMDAATHKRLTGVDNGPVLTNLRRVLETQPHKVCVRVPLLPGVNDGEDHMAAMADFLRPYGCTEVTCMPLHHFGSSKYAALNRPVPDMGAYGPEDLCAVVQRFARHGLTARLI